jgi:hypothetical protein
MSPEAEVFIRDRLSHEPPSGMEPSLNRALRGEVHNKEGRLIERCEREHYFFGYSPPSKHADHIRFDLFGREVAIHRKTVEGLRGKRLTVGRSDRVEGIDDTREILVAEPTHDTTSKA